MPYAIHTYAICHMPYSPKRIMKIVGRGMHEEAFDDSEIQDLQDMLHAMNFPSFVMAKYRLDHLGTVPEGLKLQLFQLGPPHTFYLRIKNICYSQQFDLQGMEFLFKPLKKTSLRRLEVEGFHAYEVGDRGNMYTNKLLHYLPPSLEQLSLQGIQRFNVPCTFPPNCSNITWLLLSGANFTHNNLSNCLPEGLLHLHIEVEGRSFRARFQLFQVRKFQSFNAILLLYYCHLMLSSYSISVF
jgi:hypothetical protein